MRLSWRKWGVSAIAWLAVLGLAGMALAGAEGESVTPTASLSPAEVADGKTLDSGEAFTMTLHLSAEPETEYGLTITYDGDPVGVCQADAATITTNPEGSGVFECAFTTVENSGTEDLVGSVTFVVSFGGETVTENVANITVRPVEQEEEPEPTEEVEEPPTDEEETVNHGHCVSYWSKRAKAEGLKGRAKGAFVSSIAQDEEAVSAKVEDGGEPDGTCDFSEALATALAEQEADDAASASGGKAKGRDAAGSKAKGPKGDDEDAGEGTEA